VHLTSSGSAHSGYAYASPNLDAVLLTGGEVVELIFKATTVGVFNGWNFYFGLMGAVASAPPSNGVFAYASGGPGLYGRAVSGGVGTSTGTYYTLVVGTWYLLKVVVNDDATRVDFYLYDDTGAELWTDYVTTNIPTAAGHEVAPGFRVDDTNGATIDLGYVDRMDFYNEKDTEEYVGPTGPAGPTGPPGADGGGSMDVGDLLFWGVL
jgi:hypothetical protein